MKMTNRSSALLGVCALLGALGLALRAQDSASAYLTWSATQAEDAAESMQAKGRVSGTRGFMNTRTDQARSYKLRAQWFTPEVIRGTARSLQLMGGLKDEAARKLVEEAEAAGDTVVMIELDPDEGSGVIPGDWGAMLRPKGADDPAKSARGADSPKLRSVRALNGLAKRDYAYDRFWMVFRLVNEAGTPLFSSADSEAELEVHIRNKEGRVHWTIPESVRRKVTRAIAAPKN